MENSLQIPPECSKCKKRLSPCESFNNNYKRTVEGRNVYVFNEGKDYRPDGQLFMYECRESPQTYKCECNYCFLEAIGEQEAAGEKVSFTEREETDILTEEVGKVAVYKDWKKYVLQKMRDTGRRIGYLINADHQPPVSSILEARELKPKRRLAKVMFEVAKKSSLNVSLELPVVYVPAEVHREFPSSTSQKFRKHLATIIRGGDVVGAFKTTILGAMPRFRLKDDNSFKNFERDPMSQTRLSIFENSFQQHSKEMVEKWFDLLRGKGVMTEEHVNEITEWIDGEGYKDRNDPHREQVSDLL